MAAREGFGFESEISSDCAPLAAPALALIEAGIDVHCLRDLTRGGLAGGLVEIAETAGLAIEIGERARAGARGRRLGLRAARPRPVPRRQRRPFPRLRARRDRRSARIAMLRRHPVSAGAVPIGNRRGRPGGPGRAAAARSAAPASSTCCRASNCRGFVRGRAAVGRMREIVQLDPSRRFRKRPPQGPKLAASGRAASGETRGESLSPKGANPFGRFVPKATSPLFQISRYMEQRFLLEMRDFLRDRRSLRTS